MAFRAFDNKIKRTQLSPAARINTLNQFKGDEFYIRVRDQIEELTKSGKIEC